MDPNQQQSPKKFIYTVEGKLLAAGVILACVWAGTVFALSFKHRETALRLLSMIAIHLISGRAGGISVGLENGLPIPLIVFNATCIDSLVVLILFPFFIFSYKNYIKTKFLKKLFDTSADAAKNTTSKVRKFGIIGLLFFVWFPLHMTGPLVGAIIGFFLNLHPVVNIIVVLSGTFLAVLSWVYLFQNLIAWTGHFSSFIPIIVIIIAAMLFFYSRYKYRKRNRPQ